MAALGVVGLADEGAEKLKPVPAGVEVAGGFCSVGAAATGLNENDVEGAGAAFAGSDANAAGLVNENPPRGAAVDDAGAADGADVLAGLGALNKNPVEGAAGFATLAAAAGMPKLKVVCEMAGPRGWAGAFVSESELGESGAWKAADNGEGFLGLVAVYCGGTRLAVTFAGLGSTIAGFDTLCCCCCC